MFNIINMLILITRKIYVINFKIIQVLEIFTIKHKTKLKIDINM